jgi:peptidoglycan hydrolase FlgJ
MPIDSMRGPISWSPPGEKGTQKLDPERLKKACLEFETFFVSMMLKSMRQTLPGDTFLSAAPGKDVYQSMFDEELSRTIARGGGIGLGKRMADLLLRHERSRSAGPDEPVSASETPGPSSLPAVSGGAVSKRRE